jgi:hypothetical protein
MNPSALRIASAATGTSPASVLTHAQGRQTSAVAEWARCRPWIEAALAHSPGLETIEDVEHAIERCTYQVWFGQRSCAVTEIAAYPKAKALVVVHGGGALAEMLDELEPAMCAFARARGCTLIMGTGRKGWERVTRERGYRFGYLTMVKMLST